MRFPFSRNVLCSAAALILAANAPACHAPEVQTPGAQAVVAFKEQVVAYDALKGKLAASDPVLPKKATPQEVDTNQRSLAALVQSARADAKPGEFFTPGMQALVKKLLSDVLTGPGGDTVKASIMDENPGIPEIRLRRGMGFAPRPILRRRFRPLRDHARRNGEVW